MKSILALVAFAFLACGQNVPLHPPPPAPAPAPKQYIESFPASTFAAPNSPVTLAHAPDLETIITATIKGGTVFLDQTSVLKTAAPLTITIDPAGLVAGAVVTF